MYVHSFNYRMKSIQHACMQSDSYRYIRFLWTESVKYDIKKKVITNMTKEEIDYRG